MAEFRGWYRRVLWADAVDRGGSSLAVRHFLKTPARRVREAQAAVREYGALGVEAGVSTARQTFDLWWLGLCHGTMPETYYAYRLFDRSARRLRADRIVQRWESARLYRLLGAGPYRAVADMLADKRAFARWCDEHGVPSVPVLRTFSDGRLEPAPANDVPLPADDLFSKTAFGYGGKAAARWTHRGNGVWSRRDRPHTERELVDALAEISTQGPVILQRAVRNHAALREIAGGALATLRVVTIQPPGEAPRLLRSVFRIGGAGAEMDNFTQGGMVCGVDLETGRLSRAVGMTERDFRTHVHDVRPDTGAPITGTSVVLYREAFDLAVRAHAALGEFPCAGWDIAILDDGPVVLEGNWNPGVLLSQLPHDTPLGDTDYVRCVNAHLRRHFAGSDWATLRRLSAWEPHGGTNRWMRQ